MTTKETNPKDAVGVRKWRQFSYLPFPVIAELGVAMLEGGLKYGSHNYRHSGVRASVYFDAAMGHIMQWWEGEDIDPDSGMPHIVKAMASLAVLRDAQMMGLYSDDRPIRPDLDSLRSRLQSKVEELLDRYPDPKARHTQRAIDEEDTLSPSESWIDRP